MRTSDSKVIYTENGFKANSKSAFNVLRRSNNMVVNFQLYKNYVLSSQTQKRIFKIEWGKFWVRRQRTLTNVAQQT
jgi:hypothetical protein